MIKSLSTLVGSGILIFSLSFFSYGSDASLKVDGILNDETTGAYEDIKTTKRSRFEEEDTISKNMNMDKVKQRLLELSYLNEQESEQSTDIFRGQLTFASLFSPHRKQGLYDGFYRLIGMVDTDSSAKFTFTGGYFLPYKRGEVMVGYRLLSAPIRETLPRLGDFEEQGVENAAVLKYSKHLDSLIGAINADLFYSKLTSDNDTVTLESSTANWQRVTVKTGSGDVETWHTTLGYGIGSEGWNNPAISGLRLDLGAGYEEVYFREFGPISETSEKGFLGYVNLAILTPLGKFKATYRDGQSADVGTVEWQAGNLRLFWRDYGYDGSAGSTVLGFGISGDFNQLMDFRNYIKNFFRKPQRLFRKEFNGYDDINFVESYDLLEGESKFIAKPRTYGIVEDVKFRQSPKSAQQAEPAAVEQGEPVDTTEPKPESFDDLVDQLQPVQSNNETAVGTGGVSTNPNNTPTNAGNSDIAPGTTTSPGKGSPVYDLPFLILPAEDNPFVINGNLLKLVQPAEDPPTIY